MMVHNAKLLRLRQRSAFECRGAELRAQPVNNSAERSVLPDPVSRIRYTQVRLAKAAVNSRQLMNSRDVKLNGEPLRSGNPTTSWCEDAL